MKNSINVLLFLAVLLLALIIGRYLTLPGENYELVELREKMSEKSAPSVNHSALAALQREFNSPQQVTETCISCHTERHKEVMQTSHWNWEEETFIKDKGVMYIGKKDMLNNLCIGVSGNENTCMKCHIGYGWSGDDYDFDDYRNIDCLVCHDNSDKYKKGKGKAGYPSSKSNLTLAAQSVSSPQRSNCGSCHFFGGGGNNAKHGDLDAAMIEGSRDLDVHMGVDGANMHCVDCHEADKHQIPGQMYTVSSNNIDRLHCESCHSETPHAKNILNDHTVKVSCQTCHIPEYARENATIMNWDWSTAGDLWDGKPYYEDDEDGNKTYMSQRGSMTWEKNVQPEYIWFKGTAGHYLLGDPIEPSNTVKMNSLNGEFTDGRSKIIPVKVHRANQLYDAELLTLVQPQLTSKSKGDGGYWKDFDWNSSVGIGMKNVNAEFSGKLDFIETELYLPVNHQVAPVENSVQCIECHTREEGRLAGLNDFYMSGRDSNTIVDVVGKTAIILSILVVIAHAILRIAASKNRKRDNL